MLNPTFVDLIDSFLIPAAARDEMTPPSGVNDSHMIAMYTISISVKILFSILLDSITITNTGRRLHTCISYHDQSHNTSSGQR